MEGCQDQLGLEGHLWEIVWIINWCGKTQSAAGGTIPGAWVRNSATISLNPPDLISDRQTFLGLKLCESKAS